MSGDTYNFQQAGAVGPHAHAHDMTLQSASISLPADMNLAELAADLQALRNVMQGSAASPDEYLALAEVSLAEQAAANDDKTGVVAHLAKAGKWALDTASEIGAKVLAEVITHAIGAG
jgi:hypothetical protein